MNRNTKRRQKEQSKLRAKMRKAGVPIVQPERQNRRKQRWHPVRDVLLQKTPGLL